MENENNQANSNNIIQTFTFKDYNKTTERSTFRKLSALVKIHEDIKKGELPFISKLLFDDEPKAWFWVLHIQ